MKKRLLNKIALGIACLLGIGVSFISTPTDMNVVYAAESDYRTEHPTVYLHPETDTIDWSQKTFTEDASYGGAKWSLTHTPTSSNHSIFQMSAGQKFVATRQITARYITKIDSFLFTRGDSSWSGNLSVKVKIGSTEIYSASGTDYDLSVYNRAVSGELSGTMTIEVSSTSSSTWYFRLRFLILKGYVYKPVSSTLNDNGGSGGQGTVGLTYGETMPNVTVPSKTGYRFDGYYIGTKQYYKGDGTPAISSFDVKSDSITLTAKWTLMQFDVTLNKQGGTGGDDEVVAIYGDAMPTATMPTRTGYNFLGYFDETSGGKQYYDVDGTSTSTYDKMNDSTLYAQWDPIEYHTTFDSSPGSGGLNNLDIYYDAELPTLTNDQIPHLESSGGHSFSFGGYFTEQPTLNEDGSYTPHGTQYYDKDGNGVGVWKEANNDTILYAYYTIDMEVTSSGYSGVWDGNKHGITVKVNFPEGTTTYYGESASSCNNPNKEGFDKDEAGSYEIFYEVRLVGYTPYPGHETILINKDESIIDPTPSAIDGLEFTSEDQKLVNAGDVDYGKMLYAVNTTGELPDDSEFSETIPTGKLVGTYYVFYKSSGDDNHNEYAKSLDNVVEVSISRVDRSEVISLNEIVLDYLETIKDNPKYEEIIATLEAIRSEVYNDAIIEDNITATEVANNVTKLQEALSAAKVAVTEALINAIGTVSYPDSQDEIEAAQDYYDSLTPEEQAFVDTTLLDTLNKDSKDYEDAKTVADLINAIPVPSDSEAYYDAVEAAKEAYDALATSNPDAYALVNNATDVDYEKVLEDNVEAKEVIELIEAIGDLTYNGGTNDSLEDIQAAEQAYTALVESNPDAAALVNQANHDDLVDARESYDEVDETIGLINSIGNVSHGGDSDSQEAIEKAREAYNSLSEEEKALVNGYNDSYQTLDDAEHVYEAMVLIDEIGSVSYDSRSEEAIEKAREAYDSLTDEQKEQLGEDYLNTLTHAEEQYAELKKNGNILVIILLIVACLTLGAGIWFLFFLLKRRKKDDDDQDNGNGSKSKKEPVKAMSVGGFIPFIILTSHYFDAPYITLYIIAGLAVLMWIANLVIAIMKKKQVGPFKKKELSNNSEVEEVINVTDEKGNKFQIRYIKSFTAKLIQANEESKKYYEELKNYALSYKEVNSRVSWHYDSINAGRKPFIKFGIRGKTLCVYYPLDVEKVGEKYKVEKIESKRYESVPCMYRINNDRRLGYAKELIDRVARTLGLEKGEEQHESYANLPYEENKPLIERGLIKELKVQVNKLTEPVVLETKVNSDGDEIVVEKDSSGNIFEIRYIKSFTAKLSQSSDEVKNQYNELKNYVLSYKGTNSRVSWHFDSVNVGRNQVLKFSIRGKTLCVYYALDEVDEKYKVEKTESKKFAEVPTLYRIKNDRKFTYAKELFDILMRKLGTEKGKELNDDYRIPFEETKALLAKGLIKEVKTKVNKTLNEHHEAISVAEADERMSDDVAESKIEEDKTSKKHEGKKGIINIDTIGENFNDGDLVDLEALWAKKLVPTNVGNVKVLARGILNKRLNVDLQDYSIQAVKMILLEGGTVKKAK